MTDAIIRAVNVDKFYRSTATPVHALKSVSLEVARGEMVAVMGPSGCGKTTLLNCLSGLDSIDSGEVVIEGELLGGLSDDDLSDYRARRMGFVFQTFNLLPVLSAVENVELPLLLAGVPTGQARAAATERLALVGLADRLDHTPAELSVGQRQRVALARSLANDPAIVWADEPTGNLDSENEREVMDLLTRLNRERGQTFVIVTHSDSVGARAHRVVRMRDGVIEDHGRSAT
ncbi:MAG: ABC transporter ATP-binding protein [Chloroflexi bacterium]|nr:ABC transporter ATP-binding protein [Chloroflexota bacterium]